MLRAQGREDLDIVKLRLIIDEACSGVEDVSADDVFELIDKNIYDNSYNFSIFNYYILCFFFQFCPGATFRDP